MIESWITLRYCAVQPKRSSSGFLLQEKAATGYGRIIQIRQPSGSILDGQAQGDDAINQTFDRNGFREDKVSVQLN